MSSQRDIELRGGSSIFICTGVSHRTRSATCHDKANLCSLLSLFPGCCTHQIQAQCSTHLGVGTRHLDCFHINIIPLLVVGRRHARDIEGPEIRQGKGRDIFPFLPEFLASTFQPRYLADVRSKGRRNASRAMSTVFRSVQG